MRILVVNALQHETVGDAALLTVLLGQLEEAFPGCSIDVSSLDDPRHHPRFLRWRNLGSLRRWSAAEDISRPRRALRKVFVSGLGLVWFRGPRGFCRLSTRLLPREVRDELEVIECADLVVACSGGYLNGTRSLSGDLSVLCTVAPITLAERLRIPVIFAPQSIGPFGHALQSRSVARALQRAELVLVREDTSYELAQSLCVTPPMVRRSVDSAFALRPSSADGWRDKLSLGPDEVVVGVTARDWLPRPRQDHLERALACFVDHVQGLPRHRVLLIPQNTSALVGEDDRDVNRRIAGHCLGSPPILVEEHYDPAMITGLYGSLDFVVGMRFHSIILALISYVPSVAIEYHHKAGGIMRDLGLEQWTVLLDDLTPERLVALFGRLERDKDLYLAQLRAILPGYVATAQRVPGLLRTAYSTSGHRRGATEGVDQL